VSGSKLPQHGLDPAHGFPVEIAVPKPGGQDVYSFSGELTAAGRGLAKPTSPFTRWTPWG